MEYLGRACSLKVFFTIFEVFCQPEQGSGRERQGHMGIRCNRHRAYFLLVNDSNKGFKPLFFYVRAISSASKREIADIENGKLVKEHFHLSRTREHFNRDESTYAVSPRRLAGDDAVTFNLLVWWVKEFSVVKKIDCAVVIDVVAESSERLKAYFGS